METGMMKIVFSSIMNGTELSAHEEKLGSLESIVGSKVNQLESKQKHSGTKADAFDDKTSQEVFASLVNASNCANLQSDTMMHGYVTFTRKNDYKRKYHI